MRELRTVLIMVPPLLAGLIQEVVTSRLNRSDVRLTVIESTGDLDRLSDRLGAMAPDLVIIGPANGATQRLAASASADARVLTLSTNLDQLFGPGPTDVVALTPDTLTRRLRDLLQEP